MAVKTNPLKVMFEDEQVQKREQPTTPDPKFRRVFDLLKKGDYEGAKKASDLMESENSATI